MSNVTIGPTGAGALPLANSIDAVNDLLPIYQNATVSTLATSRNTLLNLSSQPLGQTDTQTGITNKTFVAPVLGSATATSINKVAITAPASSATLTIANGKTLTANNSLTLAGTDATTMTFPSTTDTVVTLTATQTLTNKTLTSPTIGTSVLDTNGNTEFTVTATASAVNYLTFANSSTTNPLIIGAAGTDSNIGITLSPKGSGAVKLLTALYNPYKFSVTGSATTLGSSATAIVVSTTKTFDTGSNVSAGIFTASIAGFYGFIFTGILGASNGAVNNGQFFAYKNGSLNRVIGAWLSPAVTGYVGGAYPFFLQLAANDTVQPYGLATTGGASFTTAIFEGFLVSAT